MKNTRIVLLILSILISAIHGDPFLFFPEHMLPPIGTTFNFTFEGLVGDWKISGIYTVQPVVEEGTTMIIGYRNWQIYTGQFDGRFYGVSYKNNSYPQATLNPQTQECENVFVETVNCTTWKNSETLRWDSRCSIVRIDSPITGEMSLIIHASSTDSKRPTDMIGTTSISGSALNMTIAYQFLSQTAQTTFPYVKCSF